MTETAEREDLVDLAQQTLTGDVRDHLLQFIKTNKDPLPFSALSEVKQREVVESAERFADRLVKEVVGIVAADGRESLRFSLKGIQQSTKGNIQVKLETPFTEDAWNLLGPASTVELVVADSRRYEGERRPGFTHVSKDQPDLPIEGDGDDKPVMDQTSAGKAMNGAAKAPADKEPGTRPNAESDAWFTTPERTELSDEGYIALARLMRASDAPLKESLRKLKTYYRILDRAIDEKRLFTICEAEESEAGPSDDPDEDLPAFLRSKKEPPSDDDEDGDESGPEFT